MYQCIKDNTMVAREKHSYPINFNETHPHFITHPYFTPSHFSEKKTDTNTPTTQFYVSCSEDTWEYKNENQRNRMIITCKKFIRMTIRKKKL